MKPVCAIVVLAFCLFDLPIASKADNLAYMSAMGGDFGTIDLDTGVFTVRGNSHQTLAGLAVQDGTIYGTSYHISSGALYKVNRANGALTLVGVSSISYDDFGYTSDGTMYAIGLDTKLYSINANTGAATLIGPTGLSFGSARSLSIDADGLYFANGANLYTLNTTSGAATLIGNTNSPQISSMLMEGGILYGGDNTSGLRVDRLDVATGAVTLGPTVFGTTNVFRGFAPFPETLLNDVNLDGHVDTGDLAAMMIALSNPTAYAASKGEILQDLSLIGDANQDTKFNNADIQKLIGLLKSGGGSQSAVPEPDGIVLIALTAAILMLATANKRRRLSCANRAPCN
jgi:hypothetical protein